MSDHNIQANTLSAFAAIFSAILVISASIVPAINSAAPMI